MKSLFNESLKKFIKYQPDILVTDVKDKFDLSQDIYGVQKNMFGPAIHYQRYIFLLREIVPSGMIKVFISFKNFYVHLNFLVSFLQKTQFFIFY